MGGWADGQGERAGTLGAPLAVPDSPFSPPPPRDRSRDAHWVRPELVAEVGFGNWTDGGLLRPPVYLGQRHDKGFGDIVREPS